MQTSYIKYPFGKAEKQSIASGAAMPASINSNESILNIAQMVAAGTLNLAINSEMDAGGNLTVKVSADGTNRAFTPGTGMTGPVVSILANKSFALTYKYDGSTYVHVATIQLN